MLLCLLAAILVGESPAAAENFTVFTAASLIEVFRTIGGDLEALTREPRSSSTSTVKRAPNGPGAQVLLDHRRSANAVVK